MTANVFKLDKTSNIKKGKWGEEPAIFIRPMFPLDEPNHSNEIRLASHSNDLSEGEFVIVVNSKEQLQNLYMSLRGHGEEIGQVNNGEVHRHLHHGHHGQLKSSHPELDIKNQALRIADEEKISYFIPESEAVERIVKEAYDDLIDLVRRMPTRKHYHDVILGGTSMPITEIKAWVKAASERLAVFDSDSGIVVEEYSFSNRGDPFYMGPADMIEQKGIRFVG